MSSGLASRLKHPKKHELIKSHSQAQLLANKLRQDGVMVAVESVLQAVDQVAALLASNVPEINYKDSIINLCQHLKVYGAYLEILYKEQLDHAFKIFRDKAQDDIRVDMLSRLHLLELIELRAKGWKGTDGMNLYYKKKLNQYSQVDFTTNDSISNLSDSMSSVFTLNSSQPILGPGEILKPSGKFAKPTRIPGKKYCKDEVVIRNADSGKVMGIKGRRVHMIEELSETIISFQRVSPGAKERLVQITGANEESINHAKQLIEDTIRRNASPIREGGSAAGGPLTGSSSSINSSASDDSPLPSNVRASRALMHSLSTPDANLGEFKYTVIANGHTIKITGDNLDLVRTSKLVLDEYFSGEPIHDMAQFYSFDSLPHPILPDDMENPRSPSGSIPSPGPVVNGQPGLAESPNNATTSTAKDDPTDEEPKIRKPHLTAEELCRSLKKTPEKETSPQTPNATMPKSFFGTKSNSPPKNHNYSIEILANLAMSPFCLTEPLEWERIVQEHPMLVRKVVQKFDAEKYLSIRTKEPSGVINAEDVVDD